MAIDSNLIFCLYTWSLIMTQRIFVYIPSIHSSIEHLAADIFDVTDKQKCAMEYILST